MLDYIVKMKERCFHFQKKFFSRVVNTSILEVVSGHTRSGSCTALIMRAIRSSHVFLAVKKQWVLNRIRSAVSYAQK